MSKQTTDSSIQTELSDDSYKTIKLRENEVSSSVNTRLTKKESDIHTAIDDIVNKDIKLESDSAVTISSLTSLIDKFDERKDARCGILRTIDKSSDPHTVIRDSRFQTEEQKELLGSDSELHEKYAMIHLSSIRGALTLMEIEGKQTPEAIAALTRLTRDIIDNKSSELKTNLKRYNKRIYEALKNCGIDGNLEKKLFAAKEFSNLDDEHRNIVTLTRVTTKVGTIEVSRDYSIAEVIVPPLSEKQKEEFQKIKTGTKPSWFESLDPIKQKLVEKYSEKIMDGKHALPTQFFEIVAMPGLRNAYRRVVTSHNQKTQENNVLSKNFAVGAPVAGKKTLKSLAKKELSSEQDRITASNIDYLSTLSGKKGALLQNLTSRRLWGGQENSIFKLLHNYTKKMYPKKATEDTKKDRDIEVSHTPINRFRMIVGSGKDLRFMQEKTKEVKKAFMKKIAFDSTKKVSLEEIYKSVQKLECSKEEKIKLFQVGRALLKTEKALRSNEFISNEKTSHVLSNFYSFYHTLENNQKLLGENNKNLSKEIVTFCKSAKDRTGLVRIFNDATVISNDMEEAVISEIIEQKQATLTEVQNPLLSIQDQQNQYSKLEISISEIEEISKMATKNATQSVIDSGHAQQITGVQGGSIGAFSFKTNAEFKVYGLGKGVKISSLSVKSSKHNKAPKYLSKTEKIAKSIREKSSKVINYFSKTGSNNNKTQSRGM